MKRYFSSFAGANVRWFDFPGHGDPVVFIHGLGCASSYDYPGVATDPAFSGQRALLIDLPGFGYSDKPGSLVTVPLNRRGLLWSCLTVCS
jgi:pimeloyl-ACP methyl ester carboxylesterase